MKLFLISQRQNIDHDTYDSAVVAAPDAESAQRMHPSGKPWSGVYAGTWCDSPDHISVTYLGKAAKGMLQSVVCASFNAG